MNTSKNSLLNRSIDPAQAETRGYFAARLRDQDMHQHFTDGFTPESPTEFLIWVTEVLTYARRLGHHDAEIKFHAPKAHDSGSVIAHYCRFPNGVEWYPAGVFHTFDRLSDELQTLMDR